MTKLLLFSDVHTNLRACKRLVEMAAEADIVIGAGDFCAMRRRLDATIAILSAIDKPTVLVPGNGESFDELQVACKNWASAHVLHGTGVTIAGISFWGVGGGIPVTPFGAWSYDFTEVEAETLLASPHAVDVLITHSPPYGAVDTTSHGNSIGSYAIRTVIEEQSPELVVCGHVHDCAGQSAEIGLTTVINAGFEGYFYELKLN